MAGNSIENYDNFIIFIFHILKVEHLDQDFYFLGELYLIRIK